MNRNRKISKTLMGVTLASSLVFSGISPQSGLHVTQVSAASEQNQEKKVIYVDGSKQESGDGTSKASAVNSLEKAKELSEEGAKILICGTITVSEETTLRMPTKFEVSRADGFTGPILTITGKGKVTLTYSWLSASDVDTTNADLGKDAFVVGDKTEQKEESKTESNEKKEQDTKNDNTSTDEKKEDLAKADKKTEDSLKESEKAEESKESKKTAPEIIMPGSLTMSEVGALSTISLTENFSGDGTFRFAEPDKVLDTYESQQQIIFTPNDTDTYDYSNVEGWSEQGKEVVRYITVFVDSLKPEEPKDESEETKKEEVKTEESKTEESENQASENEDSQENTTTEDKEENLDASEEKPEEEITQAPSLDTDSKNTESVEEKAEEPIVPAPVTESQEQVETTTEETKTEEPNTEEKAPIGNLEDASTGIKVDGDFLPPYVDLRVSRITDVDEIEEADIEAILKSYEITLWNLKTDEEYVVPEGKKVTVMIPVPQGAQLYESLIIAHYMEEKGEYEYFVAGKNLNIVDGYLVFETASFSPFNVGGNQLVGIGTKSPNHKPSASYYSDMTAGSLTMVPAAGNMVASSKNNTDNTSTSKKSKTTPSASAGAVIASSSEIGSTLNRSSASNQSDASVTPIERPTLLTTQNSSTASDSTVSSTNVSSNAKTGDNTNIFGWLGAAMAAFAVMVKGVLTWKRKN